MQQAVACSPFLEFELWLKLVFKNVKLLKVFLFSSLGMAMDAFIKAGLMNFGPKIIEVRFQTDAATAAVKEPVSIIRWQFTKRLTDRLGIIRMNESYLFSHRLYFIKLKLNIVRYCLHPRCCFGERLWWSHHTNFQLKWTRLGFSNVNRC